MKERPRPDTVAAYEARARVFAAPSAEAVAAQMFADLTSGLTGSRLEEAEQHARSIITPYELALKREVVKDLRIARALRGECRECGTPCEDTLCAEHRQKERGGAARRRRAAGMKECNACPCGVPGHYLRACPTEGTPPRLLLRAA